MKNMMKKTLSVIIALAMILVPMSVFAAEGDADQPYQLSTDSFRFSIYVAPGATAYVQASDSNNSTVTVGYVGGVESGEQSYNYAVQYGRQYLQPDMSGAVSFSMMQGYDTFTFTNNSEEEVFAMMTLQAAPTAGTWDNPEVVELKAEENYYYSAEINFEAGNQGYYYNVTAPGDGAIGVSAMAFDPNNDWADVPSIMRVNNLTAGVYGEEILSTDVEYGYIELVEVSAGDVLEVFVSTNNPNDYWNAPAGLMYVDINYATPGSWTYPATAVLGENTANIVDGNPYYYTWTATEAGTATVTMNEETNWFYSVDVETAEGTVYGEMRYFDDDPVIASEAFEVAAGDVLNITMSIFDPTLSYDAPAPSGDMNWTLSFVAGSTGDGGDGEQGGDIGGGDEGDEDDVNYVNSDTLLVVGDNACVVDGGYEYTIYTFEPTEEGEYTITSDNSVMGIVSANGMWVTVEPSADTVNANELVWECTGVGQSIWVAVKADTNVANITITRAELDTSDEIPWVDYENMETPEAFTFEDDADKLVYVDVEDDVDDNMNVYYNDEDGYYHYGAEDGPIIYVNLDESMMSMVGVVSNGKLVGANYDIESGEVSEYVNCTNAIMEYIAAADTVETADGTLTLYPLTDDLIVMYIACGSYMGWYGEDGWLGLDTPDAWMFACYYVDEVPGGSNEGNEGEDNTGDDNTGDIAGDNAGDNAGDDNTGNVADPEIPNTDNEAFGVAIAMMATAAALGATVVTTKKSKRVK